MSFEMVNVLVSTMVDGMIHRWAGGRPILKVARILPLEIRPEAVTVAYP